MANEEHVRKFIELSTEEWNEWIESGGISRVDLSGKQFEHECIGARIVPDVNLTGTIFHECELKGVHFKNGTIKDTYFRYCVMDECEFVDGEANKLGFENLRGHGVITIRGFRGKNMSFSSGASGLVLEGVDMAGVTLLHLNGTNLKILRCKLTGATLKSSSFCERGKISDSDFREGVIHGCEFPSFLFRNCRFRRVTLDGEVKVYRSTFDNVEGFRGEERFMEMQRFVRMSTTKWFSKFGRRLSWEHVRMFGSLPLFGASYGGMIIIFLWASFVHVANEWVERANNHVNASQAWINPIPTIEISWSVFWTFLSLCLLFVAALFYRIACPSVVKESSETKWVRELGHPTCRYRGYAYSLPKWCVITAILYVTGGLWVVGQLLYRIIMTFIYLFG